MINVAHCLFLFHHTPPLGFGGEPLLLLCDADRNLHIASFEELSTAKLPVVTHSFSLLVDWFRIRALALPKMVVDLESAQKLLIGYPKSDFEVERPWDMPSMMQRFVHARYDAKGIRAALATHLTKPKISEFANLRWMAAIAKGLDTLWRELLSELERKDELRRFLDVEIPAYNAMLISQYRGIRIDAGRRDHLLHELEKEYVSAHYKLAIGKRIDVERALADVKYLNGILSHPIQDAEEFIDAHELIAARKDVDPVCALLDVVLVSQRSRNILFRTIGNDGELCYPVFDTLGTVTGRILAVDPHLQHLNKKYRNVIQASAGNKLVYVDYSQFEPNIMASISKDAKLLELCGAGDIYQRLAVELCGDAKFRSVVKLMFIAYSYGKRISTLPDFLVGIISSREKAEAVINEHFVPLFAGVEEWKSKIEGELAKNSRIGTLLGNHRYRGKSGELEAKERRWAVSQVVQGTGSLILKKLINLITAKLPQVAVLLPMYDALLVEMPEKSAAELTAALLDCCRESFSDVCPLVTPSICEKAFAE